MILLYAPELSMRDGIASRTAVARGVIRGRDAVLEQ
jgi:hypothetical protein